MTENYYDHLAPYYKYLFPDWEASVQRQASQLESIIHEFFGPDAHHVLDAACGIGTQSIGLAGRGFTVTASDLSPVAVETAAREAARRGFIIAFRAGDMRELSRVHMAGQFDVVIACDNAVPHLLTDDDIRAAFLEFHRCTTDKGGCVISVRDYANLERRRLYPRLVHDVPDGHIVLFDRWEFDSDQYELTTYVIHDTGGPQAETQVIAGGRYYCVSLVRLEALMLEAGFRAAVTLTDRFFQPVIVGLKRERGGYE